MLPDFRKNTSANSPARRMGRGKAISRSLPTMMVSVWWRAWLQRQNTVSCSARKEVSWKKRLFSQPLRNGVPCDSSCEPCSPAAYSRP